MPNERVASCVRARASPAAATSSASSQLAGRSVPFSRTKGSVSRPRCLRIQSSPSLTQAPKAAYEFVQSVEKTEASRNPVVGRKPSKASGTQSLHGLPLLERLDHDHRDSAKVVRGLYALRHRELGRLPVIPNHRDGDRLRFVILAEG